ncbi:MAG: UvrD-helicase domain-containing protein [Nitrospinaceae bacterium]|nr:UvrD-helicase domain-containing protein [Nitrospinaceae bacterium]
MNVIIDAQERQKALDPTRSFLVQAPAGSGKTELLIQRYLKLLGGVEYPEQILSMTFTRKAAGEMKSRILEALKRGLDDSPPDSDHESQTWKLARLALQRDKTLDWRLLDNPNQLRILTIDSFCAGIIKQMPVISWMGGPLDIKDNADDLYRETAKRLLAKVESNDDTGERIRTVLKHLDNSKQAFLTRVIQLLQKRDQWIIPFFNKFNINDDKRKELEGIFSNLIEAVLTELHSILPAELRHLPPLAHFAASNLVNNNPGHPVAALTGMNSLPSPEINHLSQWKAMAELLLTAEGNIRKNVNVSIGFPAGKKEPAASMKQNLLKLLESLAQHENFIEKLHEARNLPDPYFTDDEWNVLKSTLMLLPDMANTLRHIFAEQGKTDFTEISLSAREALGSEEDPTDLLLYLDYKFQHILVDEYQDTSYKQYDLLLRLTAGWMPDDGRTLFIVGDPMQSIYRFRDAEVGLFLKTKNEGIGYTKFVFLALKTNFRSQKKIVDWVNQCFNSVFPEVNNQDLGAIAYSPCEAALPEETLPGVVLHSICDDTNDDEANQIANLVSSLRKQHKDKTIAILVRARSHLTATIRKFHEKGIRFHAEDIDPLTSRPEIMDLLSLMRALTSLTDRVAWLSVLRAPWCGLSLDDLHKLCAADGNRPIWNLLNDTKRINTLSTTGRHRVNRIKTTFNNALKALPVSNFRDLLEGCWIHLGGPACSHKDTFQDIEVFFDKVSDFLNTHDLSQLRFFQRDLKNLFANPMVEENNAVQIMTMHKAKGLEFDLVILPRLERTSKAEEKRLVYWMPHGDDLLVAPIEEKGGPSSKIYKFLSQFDREKSDFETLRLLYVATTRTKTQLHMFGQYSKDNNSSPPKGSLLNKLWPYIKDHWPESSASDKSIGNSAELPQTSPIPKIRRIPENHQLPAPPPGIETGIVPELQHEPETPDFVWAGSGARHLGTVMHRCFQIMAEEGIENLNESKIKFFENNLSTALLAQGLPPEMSAEEIKKGKIMLRNILDHDKGRWILESHEDARCEYPLTQIKSNTYQSRVIDRTFIDKDNIRWIIDYKTGQHLGSDLGNFFENEKVRYQNQLNQYEKLLIMSGEKRTIKKALYYPIHKELLILE